MTAKRFARIQDGGVAEIFSTRDRLETLFHSALIWVDVTDRIDVAEGWRFDGNDFAPPRATRGTQPFRRTITPPSAGAIALAYRANGGARLRLSPARSHSTQRAIELMRGEHGDNGQLCLATEYRPRSGA